ncbi:MAG: hypothetical protein P1U57_15120, partial [Oleibacter sp.]|nr:hypothetical protein [Thalassolituus sp.]
EFFNEQDADNGARAFNFGFAATANLAQQTEIDISIHQQYLEWDSGVENGKGANATIRSLRLTLRQLF